MLSTDNGRTWEHVLAGADQNDGRARVVASPTSAADKARIDGPRVDNYFFDINDSRSGSARPRESACTWG